ncbi:MAG: hypothetical protein AAFP00_02265 [Bacteroidota bacterium]
MYQNIEEYIQSQRQQLDVEVPGDAVWDKIDQSLDRKTRSLWERYPLLKVAAAILLFAVGLAVVVNNMGSGKKSDIVADIPSVSLPIDMDQWKQAEVNYESRIESLMQQMQQVSIAGDPEAMKLNKEIEQINLELDKQRALIKADNYQPSQGKRMLELYEQKIIIMQKMVDHLEL